MPPAEYEQQYYLEIAGYAMGSTTASSDAYRRNCDKAEGGELEHRSPRRDAENAQRIRLRCGTAPGDTPARRYVGAEHSDRDRSVRL